MKEKDRQLSETEVDDVLNEITTKKNFESCNRKRLKEIIQNSRIQTLKPYEIIWDKDDESKIELSLILEGCVAVIYSSDVRPAINALLTPFQFFGEFELVDPNSQSQKLKTLTHSKILIPAHKDIETLMSDKSKVFFEVLTKTLVQKLKFQNHVINFRSRGRVNERIAYFLYRLNHKDLRYITERNPETENAYDVNIFFSTTIFESFVYSEHKTICENLAKLVSQGVIEVTRFHSNFKKDKVLEASDLKQLAEVPRNQVNEDNYIKIRVTDLKNMKSKNGMKTFN
jgi:CRP-like cAMP-binding protein